jgi:hypothetical protein
VCGAITTTLDWPSIAHTHTQSHSLSLHIRGLCGEHDIVCANNDALNSLSVSIYRARQQQPVQQPQLQQLEQEKQYPRLRTVRVCVDLNAWGWLVDGLRAFACTLDTRTLLVVGVSGDKNNDDNVDVVVTDDETIIPMLAQHVHVMLLTQLSYKHKPSKTYERLTCVCRVAPTFASVYGTHSWTSASG